MQIDYTTPVRDKRETMGQHPSDFLENRLMEAIAGLFRRLRLWPGRSF